MLQGSKPTRLTPLGHMSNWRLIMAICQKLPPIPMYGPVAVRSSPRCDSAQWGTPQPPRTTLGGWVVLYCADSKLGVLRMATGPYMGMGDSFWQMAVIKRQCDM